MTQLINNPFSMTPFTLVEFEMLEFGRSEELTRTWILATGAWSDLGIWDDESLWLDS